MYFLLFILTTQGILAAKSNGSLFEPESGISLHCKEADEWAGMSNMSCAVVATAEENYNFGFGIHDDKCMVCRAGGMPEHAIVPEIVITDHTYVDGKKQGSISVSGMISYRTVSCSLPVGNHLIAL